MRPQLFPQSSCTTSIGFLKRIPQPLPHTPPTLSKSLLLRKRRVLFQSAFERPVKGFNIPVLLFTTYRDSARLHTQMVHEIHVIVVEVSFASGQVMGRGRGIVRLGDTPELVQGERAPLELLALKQRAIPTDTPSPIPSSNREGSDDTTYGEKALHR